MDIHKKQQFLEDMRWFDAWMTDVARQQPHSTSIVATMAGFFACAATSAVSFLETYPEFDELVANSDSNGTARVCFLWTVAMLVESGRHDELDHFVQMWVRDFNRVPDEHVKVAELISLQVERTEAIRKREDGSSSLRHREIVHWLTAYALSSGTAELPIGPIGPTVRLPYGEFADVRVPDDRAALFIGLMMAEMAPSLRPQIDGFLERLDLLTDENQPGKSP